MEKKELKKYFEKEQEDVKNKKYWKEGWRKTFIANNLKNLENSRFKNNSKYNLIMWLFYQHSFQSIISNEKQEIKRFNKKQATKFLDRMLFYYKKYWKNKYNENLFPLFAKSFIKKDIKGFERLLNKKDKAWNLKDKLIKNMYGTLRKLEG